jgi:hypothetical protein
MVDETLERRKARAFGVMAGFELVFGVGAVTLGLMRPDTRFPGPHEHATTGFMAVLVGGVFVVSGIVLALIAMRAARRARVTS